MVLAVSRHSKNSCNLKTGQCRSTVWEGGGVLPKKKRFWQTPLTIVEVKGVVIIFLNNTVNIVKYISKKSICMER